MSKDRVESEKKFWAKFASRYDAFMDSRVTSYKTLIEKILAEIEPGWVVLEVAAGTGVIALRMAGKVKKVYAVDITPEMISQAEQKAKDLGVKNIVCSVDDAYALPFGDATFDAVVCSNALHTMREPQTALAEMRRVLKRAGILITPTLCHGQNLKSHVISRLMALTGFPAYHRFTGETLTRLIEDAGFVIGKNEMIKETIPMAFIVARPR
jgi:phosphatidylethanolamine/phosphatidyl-N-methylethanolamine N-methyltransferase